MPPLRKTTQTWPWNIQRPGGLCFQVDHTKHISLLPLVHHRQLSSTLNSVLKSLPQKHPDRRPLGHLILNQALVVLIPKKPNANKITEFRPISLIHLFAKLISKILANRLAPELKKMISYSQNAFIKK
jgi:hypothetical protein